MSQRAVIVTGANGGIGVAICAAFGEAGWYVIASDRDESAKVECDCYISLELVESCNNPNYRDEKLTQLKAAIPEGTLHALIHNAAAQVLAPVEYLTVDDWRSTLDVNLLAPFILTQALLPGLEKAHGSVVHMASIHAKLTKPGFAAYATSKSALLGMNRALAVELGGRVRINAVCPAAVSTDMLEAGFKNNPEGRAKLDAYHPSGKIGQAEEIAAIVLFLAGSDSTFLNGAEIGVDGGIAARLHDPD